MADTLETLEIEVKHSATGASAEIKSLTNAIQGLSSALQRAQSATSGASKATAGISKGIKQTADAAKKAQKPLDVFISSLKRIAFYRIIRGIIKSITQAFTEGLEKAYLFSQGITGEGNRFAAALDRMKSNGNAMKGQLGSAFISLLAAIEPILEQLIALVIRAADAIAQFFAAFTGGTYLKAVATSAKFVDNMKAGGKAAKEWKNQLLGFDEINRLNEPSNGGGGGGTNPLAGYDFEDTPLSAWAQKVREAVLWIEDHMELVKGIAIAIGAAIVAWKLGGFLSTLMAIHPLLGTILAVVAAIGGAIMFVVGACDAWKNGVDWTNLALMIGGVAIAAVALGIAFGGVAAAIALLVGGVAMLVIGIRDWIKTGELSTQTFWLLEAAIAAVAIALGILIGWPAAIFAAFAGVLVAIIYYWEEITAWIMRAVQALKEFFSMKEINARWDAMQSDGSVYLQGFASGGFPSEGQLFVANEAGPEMVGTIGGRTAVAPSNDIVEAVRGGVYDAMMAANSNSGDTRVQVFLDSREIKAGQQRLARAWG